MFCIFQWVTVVALASAPTTMAKVPPARSGDIAIRQEYDGALETGTIAALDLFIERHPGHPLVKKALGRKKMLERKRSR